MLSALIWIPVLGAALIGFWPRPLNPSRSRFVALVTLALTLLWTIILASQFNLGNSKMQFLEAIPWIESLGLSYQLGIDGLSYL